LAGAYGANADEAARAGWASVKPTEPTGGRDPAGAAHPPTWDLGDLYSDPGDPRISRDLQEAKEKALSFASACRGEIAAGRLTGERLAAAIRELEGILVQARRPAFYASLLVSADTEDPAALDLDQRTKEAFTEIENELLFFDLELMALPSARFDSIAADPALASYRRHLLRKRRFAPHRLSEEAERIMNQKDLVGPAAFVDLYERAAASLRFQIELRGRRRELVEEELLALLEDPDPTVRRSALEERFRTYASQSLLFTAVFNTILSNHRLEASLRRFAGPLAPSLLENELDPATVNVMLDAVERHYPLIQRYLGIKAGLLGLRRLSSADLRAPLAGGERERLGYGEAKELVLGSLGKFSANLGALARDFFDRLWIDAEARPGKMSGAFCAAFDPSHHPYIMVNFTGKSRDVSTLAHELGHGIHYCLARKQSYFNYEAPTVLAETASVFAELLVTQHMLEAAQDAAARRQVLCDILDEMYGTVFRQTALTRFELAAHERCRQGRLDEEALGELWLAEQKKLWGEVVEPVAGSDVGWSTVPHFVWHCFYCYSYAFGQLIVLALFRRYRQEGEQFAQKYQELLEKGGNGSPLEMMAELGFDLTRSGFWEDALAVVAELVEDLART